jgi:hypothetical protein
MLLTADFAPIPGAHLTGADMRKHPETGNPTRPRRWLVRAATTLAVWVVAFSVVTALLTLFGAELRSLPLALRALVLSGVLAALMANLVMPMLSVAAAAARQGALRARDPGTAAAIERRRAGRSKSPTRGGRSARCRAAGNQKPHPAIARRRMSQQRRETR